MLNKKPSDIKIGIIGNGSVGQTFAVTLSSYGYDVEVAGKQPSGIKIDDGFVYEITGDFGEKSYLINVFSDASLFTSKKDFIIIATKIYDTPRASRQALSLLKDDGAIITIQNWFCLNKIMKTIPADKSISMNFDFSCFTEGHKVTVVNTGYIHLGVYDQGAYEKLLLARDIFSNICKVDTVKDVMGFVMSRNIINSAIASIGAISGLRLGEFLENRHGRRIFVKSIREALNLMKKINICVLPYNNQMDYYRFCERGLFGFFYRDDIINILKKFNRDIKSSALVQIETKKKCEVKFVIGTLLVYADRLGLKMKYTRALYYMLSDIIKGKRNIHKNNLKDRSFK